MDDTYSNHVVAWISRGWTEDSVVEDDVICVGLIKSGSS